MEIGRIEQSNISIFRSLLLPEAAAAVEHGEPLTVLGVTEGATACGAAAAWLHGDALEVRSLYVAPDYRRRGAGRLLVDTLLGLAAGEAEMMNVSYTATRPEHDELPPFLTALGFEKQEAREGIYGITVGELAQSGFFRRLSSAPAGVLPFAQVAPAALDAAYRAAAAKGENYLAVPLTDPSVDARVSVAVPEGAGIRSFAVITMPSSGRVALAWVQSDRPQDMPLLLHGAYAQLCAHYPPETLLTVHAITPASSALVAALLPQARPVSHTYVREIPAERRTQ